MQNNNTFRREELEKMTSEQLGDLLRAEVKRADYNEEVIRQLLDILEEREADMPVEMDIDIDVEAAWQEFLSQYAVPDKNKKNRRQGTARRWLGSVAAAAAVFALLIFAAPRAMGAENIFDLIGRWTADIFEFLTPGGANAQQEYEYKTDHPGLQQVYDTVAELGVTERIVPTWIPEGYDLEEVKIANEPDKIKITAKLKNGDAFISLCYDIYLDKTPIKYPKDDTEAVIFNHADVDHYILQNYDRSNAAWTVDYIECSIAADIEEEMLCRVIQSIYLEG